MKEKKLFSDRLTVSPVEATAVALNWAPSTTYSSISRNTFPLPLVEIAGRKLVRVADLLEFIENLKPLPRKNSSRPGRPTKAQQIAKLEKAGAA